MATVTKGGTLPDTGVTKNEVYALVDSATVTAIVNADCDAAMDLASSKIKGLKSGASGNTLYHNGTEWTKITSGTTGGVMFMIDGGGAEIADGIAGWIRFPFACTLTGWTLLADAAGAIKIDVWREEYVHYPPTDADTITNAHELEIAASDDVATDADLSDWTSVAIVAGDILYFNVDSCTTIAKCLVCLDYTRP